MAFRNPVRSLPASAITGQIVGTQIAANSIATEHLRVNALDGRVITGTLIRTAATGDRIELTPDGTLVMYSGAESETGPGELTTGINDGGPGLRFGYLVLKPPRHAAHEAPELVMQLGPDGDKRWSMGPLQLLQDGSNGFMTVVGKSTFIKAVEMYDDASVDGALTVGGAASVAGKLTAGNIRMGQVTITPTVDVPTSVTVTGLNLTGTPRAFVTANTSDPYTRVREVSVSNITASQMTIWLTRTTNTATIIYWLVMGA